MKGYSMLDLIADQQDFLTDTNLMEKSADDKSRIDQYKEEKALLTRAQAGDRDAKRKIAQMLKPVIKAFGHKATRYEAPNAALTPEHIRVQTREFVKEFIRMNDYDPTRGASLKTAFETRYSNRIDNMITEAPQQTYMDRNLRVGVHKFRQQLNAYDLDNGGKGSRKAEDMMQSPHFAGMQLNDIKKFNRINTKNFVADAEIETEDGPLVFKEQFGPQDDMMNVGKLKKNDFRIQQVLTTLDPETKRIVEAFMDTGAKDVTALRTGLPVSKVKSALAKWQEELRKQGLSF